MKKKGETFTLLVGMEIGADTMGKSMEVPHKTKRPYDQVIPLRSRHLVPSLMANRWGKNRKVTDFIFLDSKIIADDDYSHEIKTFVSWKKSYDKPRQHIKKQR